MKRKHSEEGTRELRVDEEKEVDLVLGNHVNTKFKPGEVTWIKLRKNAWWPAQIVDDSAVPSSLKPQKKRSDDDLLVRLYGTYSYSYVDPASCLDGFDDVLKRHKGSHKEIMEEALMQDFGTKARSAKTKENVLSRRPSTGEEDEVKKQNRPNGTNHDITPQKGGESIRRRKVMQCLGLIAPSGSPYLKGGQTFAIVQ